MTKYIIYFKTTNFLDVAAGIGREEKGERLLITSLTMLTTGSEYTLHPAGMGCYKLGRERISNHIPLSRNFLSMSLKKHSSAVADVTQLVGLWYPEVRWEGVMGRKGEGFSGTHG